MKTSFILRRTFFSYREVRLMLPYELKLWFLLTYYRCRTRILEQEDARERERYLIKMIKIMKVDKTVKEILLGH